MKEIKAYRPVHPSPAAGRMEKVDGCGMVSWRKCPDKFHEFGLTPTPLKVKPPCIEECPVNIECELVERVTVGERDLFPGNAVATRIDADRLDDKGRIITNSLDPLICITGEYGSMGRLIGTLGFRAR